MRRRTFLHVALGLIVAFKAPRSPKPKPQVGLYAATYSNTY